MAFALTVVTSAAVLLGQQTTYTLYSTDGRRNFTVRAGSPETFALDQLAGAFGLVFTEDKSAGGLVITTRKGRIVAVPGQSFINVSGRGVVGLDAPIRKERNQWFASIDFLVKGLGPAIGEPVIIRRSSHIVLVGNVQVPQVGGRVEKTAGGARVVLTVQPFMSARVTRDGNKLSVKFDAAALDPSPVTGFIPEFASGARIDGTTLLIDLGASAASFKAGEDRSAETVTIELVPALPIGPATLPSGRGQLTAAPPVPPPQIDLAPGLHTIVIDPGHGGDDIGVRSAKGTQEKDLALQIARRLKATIESRLGLRVLLTRESDLAVPVDQRTELANHNKADLLISLHLNASVRDNARGAQVYSIDASNYPQLSPADEKRRTVPVLGGGTRVIDPMPWEMAQVPFAEQSSAFAAMLIDRFTEHNVMLHARSTVTAPLRLLAGANMPAVLVEIGFLTNGEDEVVLTGADGQTAVVESILAAIGDVRRGFPAGARYRP